MPARSRDCTGVSNHQRGCAVIINQVEQPRRAARTAGQIDDAGHEARRPSSRGSLEGGLIQPEGVHTMQPGQIINPRVPYSRTAAIAVPHPMPNSRAPPRPRTRRDQPSGRSRRVPARSTTPAERSPASSRSRSASGTPHAGSATPASPTPVSPDAHPTADPVPTSAADHATGPPPTLRQPHKIN